MRFTKEFWPGIADGTITVAFRRWQRPTVVAGRPYRTGGGRVEVVSVEVVDPEAISDVDARRSGHRSAESARAMLQGDPDRGDRQVYRVEFRLLDEPDPRQVLADDDVLTPDDVNSIAARLERLDRASKYGPWTAETLAVDREPTRHQGARPRRIGRAGDQTLQARRTQAEEPRPHHEPAHRL